MQSLGGEASDEVLVVFDFGPVGLLRVEIAGAPFAMPTVRSAVVVAFEAERLPFRTVRSFLSVTSAFCLSGAVPMCADGFGVLSISLLCAQKDEALAAPDMAPPIDTRVLIMKRSVKWT
jgi:hypothetical protein